MPVTPMIAQDAVLIAKSDSGAELPAKMIGIYVGGAGDVNLLLQSGRTVKFSAVPVGTTLYIKARKLLSTGTTATLTVMLLGA